MFEILKNFNTHQNHSKKVFKILKRLSAVQHSKYAQKIFNKTFPKCDGKAPTHVVRNK